MRLVVIPYCSPFQISLFPLWVLVKLTFLSYYHHSPVILGILSICVLFYCRCSNILQQMLYHVSHCLPLTFHLAQAFEASYNAHCVQVCGVYHHWCHHICY